MAGGRGDCGASFYEDGDGGGGVVDRDGGGDGLVYVHCHFHLHANLDRTCCANKLLDNDINLNLNFGRAIYIAYLIHLAIHNNNPSSRIPTLLRPNRQLAHPLPYRLSNLNLNKPNIINNIPKRLQPPLRHHRPLLRLETLIPIPIPVLLPIPIPNRHP